MVPVRSEPSQVGLFGPLLLPSVLPIRLYPRDPKSPAASGPLVLAVFPATIVLPMIVAVPLPWYTPPPLGAELPLTVQLTSWETPFVLVYTPPPFWEAVLPLTVQLVR